MVCLSSGSPHAPALVRKGARLADRLGVPWYGVYIQTPQESLEKIDAATQRHLGNMMALIQQLDGVPHTFKGGDIVTTIAAFAEEYGITHIVMGRSQRPWYQRLFRQSVLDQLLRRLPQADVLVVGNK
jgi:two-component system sensor histidine kinase KdpD